MKKILLALMLVSTVASADESAIKLKEGPGLEAVTRHCATCHSLDYIQMNSVFQDRAGWEATVNKMIKAMGAPIPPQEVAPLVDYLSTQYGK